jgi:hypothetical protein
MDRTGTQSEGFSLPKVDGGTTSDTFFSGKWLLLVFLRHLG